MSGFLLDTNCISDLFRPKPAPRVVTLNLSVLTVGEIRKGLAGLPESKRRTHLETCPEVEL